MDGSIPHRIVAALILWALLSLGTATVGLYARPREFWRAFWFMSGIWGLIDGLIAWFAMQGEAQPVGELLEVLRINTGLDVVYVLVGGYLLSRSKPTTRGFGLGVVVQGLFLLGFDGYFWWACERVLR